MNIVLKISIAKSGKSHKLGKEIKEMILKVEIEKDFKTFKY